MPVVQCERCGYEWSVSRGEGRLFFAPRVGREKSKQFPSVRGSVCRGTDISGRMRSRRLMMTGNLFSLVSEVAAIMTAVILSMLSDMRKGK
jgi:hypothetical protein